MHPLYYREDGSIDVTRRLGCVGCPLSSEKKRIEVFKRHPRMLRAWLIAGNKFMKNKPNSKTAILYNRNVYAHMFRSLFLKSDQQFEEFDKSNLFGKPDYKALLEEIFKCDLTI